MRNDELSHLPQSDYVGRGGSADSIKALLIEAQYGNSNREYIYMDPIEGGSRSGRIISYAPYHNINKLPRPLFPAEMARCLMELSANRMLYDPKDGSGITKGWEVRRLNAGGNIITIVWAVMVQ